MKILHISDTHGTMPALHVPQGCHTIVHSGDIMPNKTRGNRNIEPDFQRDWIVQNAQKIQHWLHDCFTVGYNGSTKCKFLYVPGNHDFFNPVELLCRMGIDAVTLDETPYEHDTKTFVGFPWCPPITNEWNYETQEENISERVKAMPKADVFVAHCPPGSVLDQGASYEHHGSIALSAFINYAENRPHYAYLCGHIHEAHGVQVVDGVLVSNAATVQQIIVL